MSRDLQSIIFQTRRNKTKLAEQAVNRPVYMSRHKHSFQHKYHFCQVINSILYPHKQRALLFVKDYIIFVYCHLIAKLIMIIFNISHTTVKIYLKLIQCRQAWEITKTMHLFTGVYFATGYYKNPVSDAKLSTYSHITCTVVICYSNYLQISLLRDANNVSRAHVCVTTG